MTFALAVWLACLTNAVNATPLLVTQVSDIAGLRAAMHAGVREIQLESGVYDFSLFHQALELNAPVRIRGAADGGTVFINYERKEPLFRLTASKVFTLEDVTLVHGGILMQIESDGPDSELEFRRLRVYGTGPMLVTRGGPSDTMRDLAITIDQCTVDCAYNAKAVVLVGVGVKRFSMLRSRITRCEKAAIQIGEAGDDVYQSRRRNITMYDCAIEGVLDREDDPGESHAIFLLACQDVVLVDLRISEVNSRVGRNLDTEAIYLKCMNVAVRGCWIHNGGAAGVSIKGVAYQPGITDPLHYRCGDNILVENCSITASAEYAAIGPTEGILIDCGGTVALQSNLISGLETGIRAYQRQDTGYYSIQDNKILGAERAIYLRQVNGVVRIGWNRFLHCVRTNTGPAYANAEFLGGFAEQAVNN